MNRARYMPQNNVSFQLLLISLNHLTLIIFLFNFLPTHLYHLTVCYRHEVTVINSVHIRLFQTRLQPDRPGLPAAAPMCRYRPTHSDRVILAYIHTYICTYIHTHIYRYIIYRIFESLRTRTCLTYGGMIHSIHTTTVNAGHECEGYGLAWSPLQTGYLLSGK